MTTFDLTVTFLESRLVRPAETVLGHRNLSFVDMVR